ncbi:MAG: hypothetical protein HS111_38410 [Kofleriaceae bacterium]|nr:hypothetical protein [Kofleriaceae bacterium]
MTTTSVGPEQLQQYLDAGQHRRLAEALADPALHLGDEPAAAALERRRWEAALAIRGEAPVIDLLVAARAHRAAATAHADTLAAQAARALRAAASPSSRRPWPPSTTPASTTDPGARSPPPRARGGAPRHWRPGRRRRRERAGARSWPAATTRRWPA